MAKLSSIDWNQTNQHVTLTGNSKYLKLTGGQMHRIRIVSDLVRFYRMFREIDGRTLTALLEERTDQYRSLGVTIAERYATYVIDRSDGKVKVVEAPISVIRPISAHVEVVKHMPFDPEVGYDYCIHVTGSGMKTRYSVTPIAITPLTNQEKSAVRSKATPQLHVLYRSHTDEEIKERLRL
jgi:hypothetical protein